MPNLIYLATYDEGSKAVNVLRVLRKVSRTFLKKYNINQILNWNGRLDEFESFETILERAQEEEKQETDSEFKDKVYELFKKVEQTLNEESRFENKSIDCQENLQNLPEYCYKVPKFKVKMNVNPRHYLTGETSHKVFQCIDGKKQINAIATDLDITHEEVYNICKNLIKLGFINLN